MLGNMLYRPVWLPVAITAVMLMIALALLQITATRSLNRLQHLHTHLERLTQAQEASLRIQRILLSHLDSDSVISPAALEDIQSRPGYRRLHCRFWPALSSTRYFPASCLIFTETTNAPSQSWLLSR